MTTAIFSFGGQGLYLETMAEMKNVNHFGRSLYTVTAFMLGFYLLTATTLYFRYGADVPSYILYKLSDGPMKTTAGLMMFLHVLVSYVITAQIINRAIHVRLAPTVVNRGDSVEVLQWLAISSATTLLAWLVANAVSSAHPRTRNKYKAHFSCD